MKKYFYTISLLFFAVTLDAQEGELDPSFANVGYSFIRSANFSVINTGYAIAVQPDGKIVTAGPGRGLFNNGPVFMITRQLPNGAPDPAFGAGGIVYIDPVASDEDGQGTSAYGITVGADGKIVVVGSRVSWYDFSPSQYGTAIVQLHANGSLDNSFSGDGILILQLGATGTNVYEAARDVSLQADGKIVISGVAFDGVKNVMTVARILPAGILDPSFNGTGVVYPDFPLASEGLGVTIQANGAILSAGSATNIAGNKDYALVRLNANGTYDAGFDGDGKFTKDFSGGMDEATDVAIQADGKLILSGTAAMPAQTPTLVRLLANGNIDNSFDNDGIRPINIAPGNTGQSVVTQPDGKIIWLITTSNVYI